MQKMSLVPTHFCSNFTLIEDPIFILIACCLGATVNWSDRCLSLIAAMAALPSCFLQFESAWRIDNLRMGCCSWSVNCGDFLSQVSRNVAWMKAKERHFRTWEKSSFSDEATLRVILEDLDDLVRIPFCEQKRLLFWRCPSGVWPSESAFHLIHPPSKIRK